MQIRCVALDFALQVSERVLKHVTTPENALSIPPLPLPCHLFLFSCSRIDTYFLSFTNPDFFLVPEFGAD